MFDPPVSTPISRITAIAASRMAWYSRSVSVWAGATVMESPVCTPMGSKFSIEQMMMTLSFRSRITSSSYSFHPNTESSSEDFEKLFAVVGHASAGAAEGERRAHDHGESDFSGELQAVFQIGYQRGFRHVETDALHGVFEDEAVFGFVDGVDVGADELYVVFLKHAAFGKFDGKIQCGLAADGGQNGESGAGRKLALDADDFFQIFAGERLDVSAVGKLGVGHDGGRVRVGQHDFVALD